MPLFFSSSLMNITSFPLQLIFARIASPVQMLTLDAKPPAYQTFMPKRLFLLFIPSL
jgi:hypothetical protein